MSNFSVSRKSHHFAFITKTLYLYLQECINFELKIGHKLCNFISFYRSPSQTQDEFEKFSENLERHLDDLRQNNPFLVVVIGDFNVKSNNWYCRDKSSLEGDRVDNITKQYELHQVIREPTHILDNTSSCIDLIFTSQPNLITESGVHPSFQPNCHHQMYMLNSTYKFISLFLIYEKFGTTKKPILAL